MQGTLNQPYVALLCIYLGMVGAAGYYALKCLCKWLRFARVGHIIAEAFFCLAFAGLCLWIFYTLLDLRLRAFYLLGIVLGAALYRFGIHALLIGIFSQIYKFINQFRRKN